MSREWKPGDVAWVPGVGRAIFTTGGHWTSETGGGDRIGGFIGVRPLVVIDPEDREQVERLFDAIFMHAWRQGIRRNDINKDFVQAALREFADPKPPKPDEPTGLGAVVEARDGRRYVRTIASSIPWLDADDTETGYEYADLDAVKVLSEGVTP